MFRRLPANGRYSRAVASAADFFLISQEAKKKYLQKDTAYAFQYTTCLDTLPWKQN
jgi:hypothetical protein